jgi:hypothetical protein
MKLSQVATRSRVHTRSIRMLICGLLMGLTVGSSQPSGTDQHHSVIDPSPNVKAALTLPPCEVLNGSSIDPLDAVGAWQVSTGNGAISATLTTTVGYAGQALRLDYNLGTNSGAWVQLRRDFNPALDLSAHDHVRFWHHGTTTNTIEIGLVSAADQNYFASSWNEAAQVPWWTYATWDLQDFRKDGQSITNTGQVKAVFISVAKTAAGVGGLGSFTVDELQAVDVISRPVPANFETITAPTATVQIAAEWIAARQQPGGLLKSWQEEAADFSWLYDQALGLLVLSDTDRPRAGQLASQLVDLQNTDGSWYFGYHYLTGLPIDTPKDIGPIAWLVYALKHYALKSGDSAAEQAALKGADWLATQQQADGSLSAITEWNLDTWWAFQVTHHQAEADRLRDYLLNQVWDDRLGRFKSSANTYQIFLDNQTWGAAFLKAVGRAADARRALSYAPWMLTVSSNTGHLCGFDGAGPFSVWNEGTLEYVAAHGENSQTYFDQVMSQQAPDGGVPNSPDNYAGYIVWLSRWHGVAPTAWLYFAGTGGPFWTIQRVFLPVVLK